MCRSTIRQSGKPSGKEARNCGPDKYVIAEKERVPTRRPKAFSTDGSSSTMAIRRKVFAMLFCCGRCRMVVKPTRNVELVLGPMPNEREYDWSRARAASLRRLK